MKAKKKVIILATCVLGVLLLLRGRDVLEMTTQNAIEEMEWSKEHNAETNLLEERSTFEIGETVTFSSGISVTVTDWGTKYNYEYGKIITYMNLEFVNNGAEAYSISPTFISIYADDYVVDLTYIEDDASGPVTIDVGRRAGLKVYAMVDPEQVQKLEAQMGDAVWVLKGDEGTSGNSGGTNIEIAIEDIEIPYNMISDSEPLANVSGYYEGVTKDTALDISMYSSPEGNVLGNGKIYVNGIEFNGELVEVESNIYVFVYEADDTVLLSFYSETTDTGVLVKAQIYSNGERIDECIMVQEYIS